MNHSPDVLDFNTAYRAGQPASLLLGNGFSMEIFGERMDYRTLKSEVERVAMLENFTFEAFRNLNTCDFEQVMRVMDSTAKGLAVFGYEFHEQRERLERSLQNLKDALCRIISRMHPKTHTEQGSAYWYGVSRFLHKFENIFTTNYDLGLYWGIMNANRILEKYPQCKGTLFKDGFGLNQWDDATKLWGHHRREQNVYFLHGALHIFRSPNGVVKLQAPGERSNLIDSIEERIQKGIYPVFISEGTSEEKLWRIQRPKEAEDHNAYLLHAYSRWKEFEQPCLFTFGSSFANDEHLLRALKENHNVERIMIGVRHEDDILLGRKEYFEAMTGKAIGYFLTKSVRFQGQSRKPVITPVHKPAHGSEAIPS